MIEVEGLTKYFDDLKAVDNISFEAKKGEVLGLLGPNGAGKSTTMKMITGFLAPTGGRVRVSNFDIEETTQAAQKQIGYVPESAPLYEEMYVREFLLFIGRMREIHPEDLHNAVDRVIQTCSLDEVELRKIETLSKGYKRRVSLAQALIHDPQVLILDEPTDGLDPNQKYEARQLIKDLARNKCVIVSTHILEEVEEICDRIVIIGKGKKLFEGTPKCLASKSEAGRIQDVFRSLTLKQSVEGVQL